MKLVKWRRNVLQKAYNEWKNTSLETLQAMVEDGRMDTEDFKFITGQDYVADQPQKNTEEATQG